MTQTLDLKFLGLSGAIGAFLLATDDGPILIETGPYSTFAPLAKAIGTHGYQVEDIRHVFLTHIHLDHAGAAWAFAEAGAKIYVHPFGAKHLIAPEKLMESARRIYQEEMDRLWGDMRAIPEQQVVIVEHGQSFQIGGLGLVAHHTPGHARHHIAWQVGKELFAGDVAGVKIENGPVVPPCPPPDIDIEAWKGSLRLIRGLDLDKLRITHFGEITDIDTHLSSLETSLDDWAHWIKQQMSLGRSADEMTPDFMAYTNEQLNAMGVEGIGLKLYEAANPAWMSVAGLMRYWTKKDN